jgi:probable biosynthetic protein (TIGR04098 family)
LRKTHPREVQDSNVLEISEVPDLATEYRSMRKGEVATAVLAGEELSLQDEVLFQTSYAINPYYEINGVNLLYFASYPMISDACERGYVHAHRDEFGLGGDWAIEASTIGRDIFYFSNCDIDDTVRYELNCVDRSSAKLVSFVSTLRRESDGRKMATILTVKVHHG